MSRIKERLGNYGISLGTKGAPLVPIEKHIEESLEIPVHPDTIGAWRQDDDKTNGGRFLRKIDCRELLQSDNGRTKARFLANFLYTGLDIASGRYGRKAWGFTETVAQRIGVRTQDLRQAVRALRVDALGETSQEASLQQSFRQVADAYIKAKTQRYPSQVDHQVEQLQESWNGSVGKFYRLLYEIKKSGRGLGGFLPYEVDFFNAFFSLQATKGFPLTQFDTSVLQAFTTGSRLDLLAKDIRDKTGIKVTDECLVVHRNILLTGSPRL